MAKNVDIKIDKKRGKMVIEVDLKKEFGRSKSEKTVIMASSMGNIKVEGPDGDVFVGVNVYRYPVDDNDGMKKAKKKRGSREPEEETEED